MDDMFNISKFTLLNAFNYNFKTSKWTFCAWQTFSIKMLLCVVTLKLTLAIFPTNATLVIFVKVLLNFFATTITDMSHSTKLAVAATKLITNSFSHFEIFRLSTAIEMNRFTRQSAAVIDFFGFPLLQFTVTHTHSGTTNVASMTSLPY